MEKSESELISYLKGISIISIILYHLIYNFLDAPNIIKLTSSFGGAGVHIFFICSGFGLYLSYLKKGFNIKTYICKRVKRVYLPYVVIIFLSFLVPFMIVGQNKIVALLSHIFLFKMFMPLYEESFGIQMWYISTIIQFYFIYPILLKIVNKIELKNVFIFSILISFLWAFFISFSGLYNERIWSSFFLQYLWEFVLGMLVAKKFYKNNKIIGCDINIIYYFIVFVISFSIFALLSFKGGILKNFNDPFSALSFICLCLILYRMNFFKNIINYFGKISYELYLVHYLVYMCVFKLIKMPLYVNAIIAIILSIIISIAYNHIIKYLANICENQKYNFYKKHI